MPTGAECSRGTGRRVGKGWGTAVFGVLIFYDKNLTVGALVGGASEILGLFPEKDWDQEMKINNIRHSIGKVRGVSLKILAIFLIVIFQVFLQSDIAWADAGATPSPAATSSSPSSSPSSSLSSFPSSFPSPSPASPSASPSAAPESAATTVGPGVAAWVVSLGKTVTYRIAASLDALVVGYLYTGSLLGGGGIALFNAVVSSTLYDLHEMAWNDFGPDPKTVDKTQIALIKTVTYRVISIINVLLTGLLFTGNFWLSSGLALGNAVIDSTIYFFHELAWSYWGPTVKPDIAPGTNG